jgi:hypothetical protein
MVVTAIRERDDGLRKGASAPILATGPGPEDKMSDGKRCID